eukprot:GHVT01062678.1.p3 GENE.GHVT01062678.1~~GHVT01062678.1.p3  ORF type:complete len:129 (-),score=22.71 GHVT01062678.1:2419-2805(-)
MTVDFGDKAKEEPVQEKQKPTRQAHTPQPASQPVRQKKQIHETAKRQEKQKHETIKRQEEQNNKEKSIPEPHEFGQSFFKGGVSYSPRSNTEETEEQTAGKTHRQAKQSQSNRTSISDFLLYCAKTKS